MAPQSRSRVSVDSAVPDDGGADFAGPSAADTLGSTLMGMSRNIVSYIFVCYCFLCTMLTIIGMLAAKGMNLDRLGKKVRPGTFGRIKVA